MGIVIKMGSFKVLDSYGHQRQEHLTHSLALQTRLDHEDEYLCFGWRLRTKWLRLGDLHVVTQAEPLEAGESAVGFGDGATQLVRGNVKVHKVFQAGELWRQRARQPLHEAQVQACEERQLGQLGGDCACQTHWWSPHSHVNQHTSGIIFLPSLDWLWIQLLVLENCFQSVKKPSDICRCK